MNNLRAAVTWIGTPLGLLILYLSGDWFFSTHAGALVGLVVGPLVLSGLALLIGALFYVFRK